MFDRFDIASAWYLFLSQTHGGQGTTEYARLCRLLGWFTPSPMLNDETDLEYGARMIYDDLMSGWREARGIEELEICDDCRIWHANGEYPAFATDERCEELHAALYCVPEHGEPVNDLSIDPCQSCGTHTHGARYLATRIAD